MALFRVKAGYYIRNTRCVPEGHAFWHEDVRLARGSLGEGLRQVFEERIEDLFELVVGKVEAVPAEEFQYGFLHHVVIAIDQGLALRRLKPLDLIEGS